MIYDIEQLIKLPPKTKVDGQKFVESIWKKFFAERHITYPEIAKAISVSAPMIGYWLNGQRPIPESRKEMLKELVSQILTWEKKHGHKLNESMGEE